MDGILQKISRKASQLLDGKESFTQKKSEAKIMNGSKVSYFLTLSAIDRQSISIHEIITPHKEGDFQDYFWLFTADENHFWSLEKILKNGHRPENTIIERELYDLFVRLNTDESEDMIKVEIPKPSKDFNRTFNPYIKRIYSYLYLLVGSAVLVFGLFSTLFVSNIQYNRMARIVNTLDGTISHSAEGNDYVIDSLSQKIESISQELSLLIEQQEDEANTFRFSRYNLSSSIRAQADKMSNVRQYSMKKAYYYLADRMENSTSYGELYYHFSRLPENNSQAQTLMATDRDNIISLDKYESVISYFLYPVRQDGEENTGEGYMISCGYKEMRLSPLGEGGFKPHFAIDIINIDNIINITENSVMNRDSRSGAIVSPADGTILENNYSESYGWYVEIEHPVTSEILEKYPDAQRVTTFFAHMDEPGNWKRGDKILANEKIGDIGNSGISTGPHLHYELRIYQSNGVSTGYRGEKFNGIEPLVRIQ